MMYISNTKTFQYLVVLSLLAMTIGGTGCDEPAQSSQEEVSSPPLTDASMRGFGNPPQTSLSPGDFDIGNLGDETAAFDRAVSSASNWKEAHQKVRDLLSSPSSTPQFIMEQSAAYAMFRGYLSTDRWRKELTEEKVEVLGFYTELLVKNQSPESEFVYAGLQELDGHWSNQRIIDAAETTIQAAEQKYGSEEQSKDSPTNASESDKPTPGLAESRKRRARRALSANRKLQAMLDKKRGGK